MPNARLRTRKMVRKRRSDEWRAGNWTLAWPVEQDRLFATSWYLNKAASRAASLVQWAGQDSNLRPGDYESLALTTELPAPRYAQ